MTTTHVDIQALTERVKNEGAFFRKILDEVGHTVVGQKHMLESLLIGLLADGHVLLEGVPGLAKTTAVKALASTISRASLPFICNSACGIVAGCERPWPS